MDGLDSRLGSPRSLVHLAGVDGRDHVVANPFEPTASRPYASENDENHAIDVLGNVLLLPCGFGALLCGQQRVVDCTAMVHQ